VGAEVAVEEASDVPDNVKSRGIREMQQSYRGEEKMQAGSGGEKVISDQSSVRVGKRFFCGEFWRFR
jgi:hypothetical protein